MPVRVPGPESSRPKPQEEREEERESEESSWSRVLGRDLARHANLVAAAHAVGQDKDSASEGRGEAT